MTSFTQQTSPIRVLFAGGGTGGHLSPALAVAQELRAEYPDAEVLFVGTADRIEATKVPAAGFAFAPITVRGIAGHTGVLARLRGLALLAIGLPLWQSLGILRRFRPDVVVGSGGYVCGPVLLAAWLSRIPTMLLEQNEITGVASRAVSRFIRLAAVTSEAAGAFFHARGIRTEVIGNPVRPAVLTATREQGIAALGLVASRRTLAIVGGSLGSGPINEAALGALRTLAGEAWFRDGWQVVHLTGPGRGGGLTPEAVASLGLAYHAYAFLDDVHHVLAAADLVVTRAGGTFLAEIAARGTPMVIIPWAGAAGDHQTRNAAPFAATGAAVVIPDGALTVESLLVALRPLLTDEARRAAMAIACRALGHPDATPRAVALIMELATSSR